MKLLDDKPHSLKNKSAPNSVVVACDCGEHFLWERARGVAVTCPKCKAIETMDLDPKPIDPPPGHD